MFLWLLAGIISSIMTAQAIYAQQAQPEKLYQQMAQSERAAFVREQARRIAREMSGTEYEFTPEFEAVIKQFVDKYSKRIGNNAGDQLGKGDGRFIFERGQTYASAITQAFRAHNVSPLIGLYLPLIESEYMNLEPRSESSAVGMFQFLPKTGQKYGLTPQELLDVEKSSRAAARYIADSLKQFKNDAMKEALALLSYNRGAPKVASDLRAFVNEQNRSCSICALTAASAMLDENFRRENIFYVPGFFAAAIVGENPQAFGLQTQPLSSY
jgi:hypothetical protein